jgi:hypothetical protein
MSAKGLKILLGTLAGLFVIWLAVSVIPGGGSGPEGASGDLATFFDGVSAEGVSVVRFSQAADADPVELRRTEGAWRVNGFRTDSGTVARFWEAVGEAEVGDLVSTNPANQVRMGVSGDSAMTLELETASGTMTLLVGKGGPGFGTAYVRLPDEDATHLLRGNLRPHLTRSLDDWRNKRVATVDTTGVQRIEVNGEGGAFAVERSDTLWVLEGGADADLPTVRGILGEMARLDATGFYGPADADTLPALGGTVTAVGESGDTLFFAEVGSGEGDRWLRVPGDSVVYRIASWRAGRLMPELEKVRGEG